MSGALMLFPPTSLPFTYSPERLPFAFDDGDLSAEFDLQQAHTTMYGKRLRVPRTEGWFGLQPYRYGGQTQQPRPWPRLLHAVCDAVEGETGQRFDSCFVNRYADGGDSIGWHADDDDWIGPWIASVTFGAARRFVVRRKDDHKVKHEVSLGHGDLLVMPPGFQAEWEHSIPKQKATVGPRWNLTFRQTVNISMPLARGRFGRGVA